MADYNTNNSKVLLGACIHKPIGSMRPKLIILVLLTSQLPPWWFYAHLKLYIGGSILVSIALLLEESSRILCCNINVQSRLAPSTPSELLCTTNVSGPLGTGCRAPDLYDRAQWHKPTHQHINHTSLITRQTKQIYTPTSSWSPRLPTAVVLAT